MTNEDPNAVHTFGGNTRTNLNIWLLNDHTLLYWLTTSSTILGAQHPLSVGVGEAVGGDDTDTSLVVAAVSRAESDTPFCLPLLAGFLSTDLKYLP